MLAYAFNSQLHHHPFQTHTHQLVHIWLHKIIHIAGRHSQMISVVVTLVRNESIDKKSNKLFNSFNMTSPPGSHPQLPHPSPSGNLMPSSPLNPQPSPMPAHSPGPNLAYIQSHPDSSPFAAMSPAAANWPGSPRPSPRPGQSPEHKIQSQGMNW